MLSLYTKDINLSEINILPNPVAYCIYSFLFNSDPISKLDQLITIIEYSQLYISNVLMCEYIAGDKKIDQIDSLIKNYRKLSLGKRVEFNREIINILNEHNHEFFITELKKEFFLKSKKANTVFKFISKIIQLRNEIYHKKVILSNALAIKTLLELEKNFLDFLSFFSFLREYLLCFAGSLVFDGLYYEYDLQLCIGKDFFFEKRKIKSLSPIFINSLFVFNKDFTKALSLSPFFHYGDDNNIRFNIIYLFEGLLGTPQEEWAGDKLCYISPVVDYFELHENSANSNADTLLDLQKLINNEKDTIKKRRIIEAQIDDYIIESMKNKPSFLKQIDNFYFSSNQEARKHLFTFMNITKKIEIKYNVFFYNNIGGIFGRIIDDDNLILYYGDTFSSGVAGLINAAKANDLIYSYFTSKRKQGKSVQDMITDINKDLINTNNLSISISLFIMELSGNTLNFSLGGSYPPVLFQKNMKLDFWKLKGPRLGIDIDANYMTMTTQIKKGDILFCHSNGLTQTAGDEKLELLKKVVKTIDTQKHKKLSHLDNMIKRDIIEYEYKMKTWEDILYVLIKFI